MTDKRILWMLTCALLLATPVWAGDYTANNGTVTDNDTGLIWQQQDGSSQGRNWEGAIAYCEGLSLANQTDWRLPNIKELESITDDSRAYPAIDPIFTGAFVSDYWSSTTYASYSDYAWRVDFSYGGVYGSPKYYGLYVRCVRGGQ